MLIFLGMQHSHNESYQHLEFIRAQGTKLLTSLPAAVRSTVRHYEVAAAMPFQPRPPLHGTALSRRFLYAVVTDWSLLLVAMSAKEEATVMLELPLLLIEDMDVAALDVDDFATDSRRSVRSTCISIYQHNTLVQKRQHQHQHQQKMQQQQAPPCQQGHIHKWQAQQDCQTHQVKQRPSQHQQESNPRQQKIPGCLQPEHQCSCAALAPLQLLKSMLTGSTSSIPQLRINRNALQQQQEPSYRQTGLNPAAPPGGISTVTVHCTLPQPERSQHEQQQLSRQLMQRLQTPVQVQQQCIATGPQPIAEAAEGQSTSEEPRVAVVLDAGGTATAGPPPWIAKQHHTPCTTTGAAGATATVDIATVGYMAGSMAVVSSSAHMAKLKGRLTIDAINAAQLMQPRVSRAAVAMAATAYPTDQQQLQLRAQDRPQQQYQLQCSPQHQQPQVPAADGKLDLCSSSSCLQLITIERASCLCFHLHQAWIGAHMRAALAAEAAPGLPAWLQPPPGLFQVQQQQRQQQDSHLHQAQLGVQQQQATAEHPPPLLGTLQSCAHWFRGTAGPSHTVARPAVGAAVSLAASMTTTAQASTSSSGGSSTSLSSEAHAGLQVCMMRFFGMHRDPAVATSLAGPFPGDEHNFTQQSCNQQQQHADVGHCVATRACAASSECTGGGNMWENDPTLYSRITEAQRLRDWGGKMLESPGWITPVSAFTPHLASSIGPAYAAHCSKLMAKYHAARRASCPAMLSGSLSVCYKEVEQQQGQRRSRQAESPGKGVPNRSSRQQRKTLRTCMQVGASVYAQHTASEARELFWSLANGLLKPCSLFDDGDTTRIKQLVLELAFCKQQQAAPLQQAFFASSDVMSFLVARLTVWGALMNLFPEGLPPIQNPAQPGRLEAWRGKPVVWTSSLMYPARPRKLLKRLGLAASSKVCFRSALNAVLTIAEKHRRAEEHAARANTGSQHLRAIPLNQTYHADPLNLSPLTSLSRTYTFVAEARRMVSGRMSSSGDSVVAVELPLHSSGEGGISSDDESEHNAVDSSTMAEATSILRWERLAGRLAARLAACKMQLVLYWLQQQLSYTEGIVCRTNWMSYKGLGPGPVQAGLTSHWTFRQATEQLVATLVNINLPGTQQLPALIPGGVNDLLWWAQSGANSWMLDYVVGVLHELMSIAEQQQLLMTSPHIGLVMEVLQQAPRKQLRTTLRCMFMRFVCLMGGSAGNREYAVMPAGIAAVLGYKYGCVLMEVLGGILGAADGLHDAFGVEVQHILQVPEVQAQLSAAAAGAYSGVLGRSSLLLLEDVLTAAGAAAACQERLPTDADGLTVATLGRSGNAMKVQN